MFLTTSCLSILKKKVFQNFQGGHGGQKIKFCSCALERRQKILYNSLFFSHSFFVFIVLLQKLQVTSCEKYGTRSNFCFILRFVTLTKINQFFVCHWYDYHSVNIFHKFFLSVEECGRALIRVKRGARAGHRGRARVLARALNIRSRGVDTVKF